MKAGRSKKLSYFLCSVFGLTIISVGVSAIAFSFSWFKNTGYIRDDFTGKTAGAYYASGTGTETDPFIIERPVHLYNLSWLQYLGQYNSADTGGTIETTYFKLSDNIDDVEGLDMGGWVLPPIGTENNPFISNFNGNGKTIRNLTISNNFSDLANRRPSKITDFDGGEIIGFFGVVGQLSTTLSYDSSLNKVYDLYLDQITIKNGSTKTLAGLLAGYVNGEMSNCGVYRGKFDFINGTTKIDSIGTTTFSNVSDYSLIGSYNSADYSWEDQPGSGGNGYGTSTDIYELYTALPQTDDSDDGKAIEKNTAYPFRSTSSEIISESTSSVTVNISANTTATKKLAKHRKATSNNIGYYVGSDLKVYRKSVDVDLYDNMAKYPQNKDITVDEEILTYLKEVNSSGYANGQYLLRLSNYYDFTSSGAYYNADYLTFVNDASANGFSSTDSKPFILPSRTIWFAPKEAGTLKFVLVNADNDSVYSTRFSIYKFKRSTPGNYSSYFSSVSNYITELFGSGQDNLYINPNRPVYFEIDIAKKDVEDGYEYALSRTAGNIYLAYMDIGASGGSDTTPTKYIKNVDFVYALEDKVSNGLAKVSDSDYSKSDVLFSISGTSSQQQFYFMRLISSGVLYYNTSSSGLAIGAIGSGTNSSSSSAIWDDETSN